MFKIGQQVVCIKQGAWHGLSSGIITLIGPKFNEIVTVTGIESRGPHVVLRLKEYPVNERGPATWVARRFEPLVDDVVLIKELESIGITV